MPLLVANEQAIQNSSRLEKFVPNSTVDIQKNAADLIQNSPVKARKAKRIRFFCNGDRYSKGVVMAIAPERYRSFDSLLNELTRALSNNVNLSTGVRVLYTMDGRKISSLEELEDGKPYVCSGQGEPFKKIDYSLTLPVTSKIKPARSFTRLSTANTNNIFPTKGTKNVVRPRIIIIVRNGNRPRKVMKLLLNKRNAPSFDHTLSTITEVAKLDTGAVRKIYTSKGFQVTTLEGFFDTDDIFYAYGSERANPDDFDFDSEELKAIQALQKGLRRNGGDLKSGTNCLDKFGKGVPKLPNKTKALKAPKRQDSSLNVPPLVLGKYVIGEVIGNGNFAVVRKCIDNTNNMEFAMKIVNKSKCVGKGHKIENEVSILRIVNHQNIIKLIAEYDTPNELFLILELVKGGDLFDAILKDSKIPELDAQVMTQNLASALAYLHEQNIVHRDIKPENLLVEVEGDRLKTLKVADFGLAQKVDQTLFTVCGTPTYVAPEILNESGYGVEIDVWAMGVILYIMLCGFPPFVSANNNQEELFDEILNGQYEFTSPYWDEVSELARDLVSHMLQLNPDVRFSAEDVLDHPWFEMITYSQ